MRGRMADDVETVARVGGHRGEPAVPHERTRQVDDRGAVGIEASGDRPRGSPAAGAVALGMPPDGFAGLGTRRHALHGAVFECDADLRHLSEAELTAGARGHGTRRDGRTAVRLDGRHGRD